MIKSQIIADFFIDWGENQYLSPAPDSMYWRMNFDGSKMLGGLGAGVVFTSPKGDNLQYVLQIHFRASNNVAEYEALVHGLKLAKEIGIRRILCFRDSDLVVHQVSGEWDAKDTKMASYRFYIQQLCGFFEGYEFHHVPRANNDEADRLSKIGSTK
jgi:ribonuclease HI